jgi:hypothetical protein
MVKTYYRNEYANKQWQALIDKAAELGCRVTYGRYGDRAEIDSTDQEDAVLQSTGKSADDCAARSFWAEHIHRMLQKSTDLRKWMVQPKRCRKDYCPTICGSPRAAEYERERLERATGFEWTIVVIPE